MKTPNSKTPEEIKALAEKEISDNQRKSDLYAMLPDSLEAFDVFVCNTSYAADMHVSISAKRYPFESPKVSTEVLRELASMFPAIPLVKAKGHFLTIIPQAKFEQWSEKKQAEVTDLVNLAPFKCQVKPASFSNNVTLEWYASTSLGIVHFEVKFPIHSARWLGRSYVRYENFPGGSRVIENRFTLNNNNVYTLFAATGEPIADSHGIINWAAGSNEHPGEKTILWVPISETPVTLEAIISRIDQTKEGE